MFALVTFCCVGTVAGWDLVDCDCVDVACCAGYADGFGWDVHCATADTLDDEHSECVSLSLVSDEVWVESKA